MLLWRAADGKLPCYPFFSCETSKLKQPEEELTASEDAHQCTYDCQATEGGVCKVAGQVEELCTDLCKKQERRRNMKHPERPRIDQSMSALQLKILAGQPVSRWELNLEPQTTVPQSLGNTLKDVDTVGNVLESHKNASWPREYVAGSVTT